VTPLYLHNGAATTLVDVPLIAWAVSDAYLRWRNRAAQTTLEWSFFVVIGAICAGFVLGFRAEHVESAVIAGGWAPVVAGTAFLVAGFGLRLWAMLELGRFFTVTVTIQADHRVVDSGPYRILRHPSYTGLLVLLIGFGIALGNWLSLLALFALPLAAILLRIRAEEAALSNALGERYTNYAARTDRLIPGIW
jgi:protein-S-isoprenylcysteine O-methyltransferase Ste14